MEYVIGSLLFGLIGYTIVVDTVEYEISGWLLLTLMAEMVIIGVFFSAIVWLLIN